MHQLYLSVLPVPGVGHGVRRRQRLVRPHRVCGTHRPRLQHDTRDSSHWYMSPCTTALHHTAPLHSKPARTATNIHSGLFTLTTTYCLQYDVQIKIESYFTIEGNVTTASYSLLKWYEILTVVNNDSFILYKSPSTKYKRDIKAFIILTKFSHQSVGQRRINRQKKGFIFIGRPWHRQL